MKKSLKIPNPQAHDMGEMFGIPEERMDAISKGMDEMMKIGNSGGPRLVYASDIFRYIEGLCDTQEELIWAISNHLLWMAKNNKWATTGDELNKQINTYGQPQKLKP